MFLERRFVEGRERRVEISEVASFIWARLLCARKSGRNRDCAEDGSPESRWTRDFGRRE